MAEGVPLLYQISYMYYSILGTMVGIGVGVLVSLVTQTPETPQNTLDIQTPMSRTDLRLYSPLIHHLITSAPATIAAAEEFKLINYTDVGTKKNDYPSEVPPRDYIDKPE